MLEGGIFLPEVTVHPINNPCIPSVSREIQENTIPSHKMNTWGEEGPKNENRGDMGNMDGDDRGCRKEEIEGKGREGKSAYISMVYFDQCSSGEGKKG